MSCTTLPMATPLVKSISTSPRPNPLPALPVHVIHIRPSELKQMLGSGQAVADQPGIETEPDHTDTGVALGSPTQLQSSSMLLVLSTYISVLEPPNSPAI